MTLRVRLYGRPGCHLCDDARAVLQKLRAEFPLTLEEVDITTDPALEAQYCYEIPVVVIDDRVSANRLSEPKLRRLLREVSGRPTRWRPWSRWIR